MSKQIDSLVVYGDSYSDIQSETKRTNGPLWSQQLATQWNTRLVSFAQPGATFCKNNNNTSWLEKQVEQYTKQEPNSSSVIHAIFLGVTDLIETKGQAKNIQEWIQCIKDQVTFLCSTNPAKIIIIGVPALEFSPFAIISHTSWLKQNIMDFNVALEEQDWPTHVEFFDTYLVFSDLLGDPSTINNVVDAYWDTCQGKCNETVNSYLWWDKIHITGAGHEAISNTIQSKEYFNIKQVVGDDAAAGLLPTKSMRWLSWLVLFASILIMLSYMFRHNRLFVSLKKKAARIYYPSTSRNNDYALV